MSNERDSWQHVQFHTVFRAGSFICLIAWLSLYGKINVKAYKDSNNNWRNISWKLGSILQKAEKHSRQCLIMLLSTQGKILEWIFISVLLLSSAGIFSELRMILWSPRHSPDLCWETSRQAIRKWHAAGNTLPYCSWKDRSDAIHQVCLQGLQMAEEREKNIPMGDLFIHLQERPADPTGTVPKHKRLSIQVWQPAVYLTAQREVPKLDMVCMSLRRYVKCLLHNTTHGMPPRGLK